MRFSSRSALICRTETAITRAMSDHRFKVGDLVRVAAERIGEVVQVLPESDGEPQYRIKSCADFSERIVGESQLEAATRPAAQPQA